jgi:predicted N-formylglutamate amidohydrolase
LLIDPNRPLGSPELIRNLAEGRPIELNASVDGRERRRRIAYWEGYHHGAESASRDSDAPFLFAVHSFTPLYEGQRRKLAIGVLFDHEEAAGERLARALEPLGEVRLNEPYSGRDGLIYSAQRHADASGKRPLEIEVRQDLALERDFRGELVRRLCDHDWH